jgi:hypothetical protein
LQQDSHRRLITDTGELPCLEQCLLIFLDLENEEVKLNNADKIKTSPEKETDG